MKSRFRLVHEGEGTGGDGEEDDEDVENERVVVKSRRINLTKAKLNMLAFQNIFKVRVGEDEISKKNFVIMRLMKQKQKERRLAVRKIIYSRVSSDDERTPTVQESFQRYINFGRNNNA